MKNLLVIPSYNMNSECYNYVKHNIKLLNEFEVVVVDNMSTDLTYLDMLEEEGINVIKSKFNGAYEAGALLQCYQDFDADNYFLLQDSIKINDPTPFLEYCQNVKDYVLCLKIFFPACHGMNPRSFDRLYAVFNNLKKHVFTRPGICFNAFVCNKIHLEKLITEDILIENKLPRQKIECEVWERIFGLGFINSNIKLKFIESSIESNLHKTILNIPLVSQMILSENIFYKKHFFRQ